MREKTAFPLAWPDGWPRTKFQLHSNFTRSTYTGPNSVTRPRHHSMEEARTFLADELRRLKASKEILSTNVKLRLDGNPYAGQAQPSDPGVALYFELKGKPVSLACDKWNRVEDNIWAIAKHVEALRGQDRWGVGSIEQAFRGYMALPGPGETAGADWWKTLGVAINATPDQVKEAFRSLAQKHHPDKGGDVEQFRRVTAAWESYQSQQKQV